MIGRTHADRCSFASHVPHFLVLSRLIGSDPDQIHPLLPKHLAYLASLREEGKVMMGGPIQDMTGLSNGDGMYVLNASSTEEAEALVSKDPFHVAGIRRAEIWVWQQKVDL